MPNFSIALSRVLLKIASALLPSFPDSPDAGVAERLVQLPLGLALFGLLVVPDLLEGILYFRVVLQSAARVQKELVDAPECLLHHSATQFCSHLRDEGHFSVVPFQCILLLKS